MEQRIQGEDIAQRLLDFSAEIVMLVPRLSTTPAGKHVARQLLRAGTSSGANYEEARIAESRADFAHKVLVAAKEMRESVWWLRLLERTHLIRRDRAARLISEGNQLVAIFRTSARTARNNM